MSLEKLQQLFPAVWAESNPLGLASHLTPIVVQLMATVTPVRVRQYPMSLEPKQSIATQIHKLQEAGILVPCQSPWNIPLPPVLKAGTKDYLLLQD